MSLEVLTVMHSEKAPADAARQREELVRRVASSVTFEKSPRLRAFFLHVCRCARENKSEEATEPQIAIYVYGRQPGYNPNDDNIVRSQARMLRMKLEHHFANEGKDEPVIITIPKGQYLPIFETRSKEPQAQPPQVQPRILVPAERKPRRFRQVLAVGARLFGLAVVWFGYLWFESRRSHCATRPRGPCHQFPSPAERGGAADEQPAGRRWPPTPAGRVSLPVTREQLMWTCGAPLGI